MLYKIKKRTLFVSGVFLLSLLSFLNINNKERISRSTVNFIPEANADVPYCSPCGCPYTPQECSGDAGDGI